MLGEVRHGDLTHLVCLDAYNEASSRLESARVRYTKAARALAVSREKLDHVVERAYQQQSFSPIEDLFVEEEAALAVYEEAVAELARAEGRWWSLRMAFAYEQEQMRAGNPPERRLN
ncbi:hypothetical protein DES45_10544 [Microvirga subterranea]|uniref:Uncharacterized protein n=1 Tax=Microvirga subterranea TaxID=186651 RepID=A0A370HIV8_9HYPH|nr:hypothetical protein DES45_10544 [Microvirga subterranea]